MHRVVPKKSEKRATVATSHNKQPRSYYYSLLSCQKGGTNSLGRMPLSGGNSLCFFPSIDIPHCFSLRQQGPGGNISIEAAARSRPAAQSTPLIVQVVSKNQELTIMHGRHV